MFFHATSLTDPPADSPIAEGMMWVQSVALGPATTTIAVIAVAAIGFLMLSGRLELRRSIVVVIGCFILFNAFIITSVLTQLSFASENTNPDREASLKNSQSSRLSHNVYDPYAGASVPLDH